MLIKNAANQSVILKDLVHRVQKNIFVLMARAPGNRRAPCEGNGLMGVRRQPTGSGCGKGRGAVSRGLSQGEFGDGGAICCGEKDLQTHFGVPSDSGNRNERTIKMTQSFGRMCLTWYLHPNC